MTDTLDDLLMVQPPTADRPLLGTMILVVEDSRYACEGMRMICQRSGARIRRAESLGSAERHLLAYRPHIAVVDLGLPDGSGLALINRLASASPRINGIIAISGDDTRRLDAMDAGADTFLPKPISSVSAFQEVALRLLPEDRRPSRVARHGLDEVSPDPIALRDDLSLALDLLRTDPDPQLLAYVGAFLEGLGKCAEQPDIAEVAHAVSLHARDEGPFTTPLRLAERLERCLPGISAA